MNHRFFRPIAIIVLSFFLWTFGGVFDIAYAFKNSDQQSAISHQQSKTQRPEEKFQKVIEDIEETLADTGTDTETKKAKVKAEKTEIESLDVEIRKQFRETEKKLKDSKLPDEILQRHYKFVKHYEDNLTELKANLDNIEKAKDKAEVEVKVEETKRFLEKTKPPSKHKPLDPDKLPHRTAEPIFKEPRTKPEEFKIEDRAQNTEDREENNISKMSFPLVGNPSSERLRTSRSDKGAKPILVAANGALDGLLAANTEPSTPYTLNATPSEIHAASYPLYAQANVPTDADLAETIEVQFTPEIRAKAAELNYNPVKIYNWVRNNIEFVPTYGSIQGANMCLQTKQCNDFDTASLLIALLRASGIHAKYVYGTIELPIEKVKNWVGGFTDANAALTLIASGGIPVTGLTSGGKIVMVRMEHVWVETYVPYGPYSGRSSNLNATKTWIPLDPSFKQYTYTEGIDLQTAVPFDSQSFLNQIKSTATINEQENYVTNVDSNYVQTTLTNYQTQLQNYINQNMPNATAGDILGKKEIMKQELGILPATLPYKRIVTGIKYSTIPDNLRHKVAFTITDPYLFETSLSYTASLPELAGKKISLYYGPATQTDEGLFKSYLPKPHSDGSPIKPEEWPSSLPAYLINVRPQLKIEGIEITNGMAIGMGKQQNFKISFYGPSKFGQTIDNDLTAGSFNNVFLIAGKIPQELVEKHRTNANSTLVKLQNGLAANLTNDEILGEFLFGAAIGYWAELDLLNSIASVTSRVVAGRLPSEGIYSYDLKVNYLYGMPYKVNGASLITDIDADVQVVISRDGNKEKAVNYMLATGMQASRLEAAIYDQMINKTPKNQGISTAHIFEFANSNGIPLYHINKNNFSTVLPKLQISAETKNDVQNAINSGKEVSIPQREVTKDGWTGAGYLVIDPNTGAGAYMMSGGFAGGGFTLPQLHPLLLFLIGALLVGIGIFAGLELGIALAIAAIVIGLYDLISNILPILNNPNLTPDQKELVVAALATFFAIGVLIALAGIVFGAFSGFVLIALAWLLLSIIASIIINRIIEIFASVQNELYWKKQWIA